MRAVLQGGAGARPALLLRLFGGAKGREGRAAPRRQGRAPRKGAGLRLRDGTERHRPSSPRSPPRARAPSFLRERTDASNAQFSEFHVAVSHLAAFQHPGTRAQMGTVDRLREAAVVVGGGINLPAAAARELARALRAPELREDLKRMVRAVVARPEQAAMGRALLGSLAEEEPVLCGEAAATSCDAVWSGLPNNLLEQISCGVARSADAALLVAMLPAFSRRRRRWLSPWGALRVVEQSSRSLNAARDWRGQSGFWRIVWEVLAPDVVQEDRAPFAGRDAVADAIYARDPLIAAAAFGLREAARPAQARWKADVHCLDLLAADEGLLEPALRFAIEDIRRRADGARALQSRGAVGADFVAAGNAPLPPEYLLIMTELYHEERVTALLRSGALLTAQVLEAAPVAVADAPRGKFQRRAKDVVLGVELDRIRGLSERPGHVPAAGGR